MNFWKFLGNVWIKVRNNPFFVTAWTLFMGALGEQFLRLANSGSFDWSRKGIEEMVSAAAMTTAVALTHLYLPKPTTPAQSPNGSSTVKSAAAVGILLVLTLGLSGCPANQSTLQKAATASEQAMIVVQGFQQGETLAYNQGKACVAAGTQNCVVISDADHLFIQQSVSTIAQIDKTTNSCIGSAGTASAAVTCANTAITTIGQLQADGDLHIKSPTARQDFDLALIGAKTALNVIATILAGGN